MAGRIPQSFIDDLLNRTDIVELIDARVRLKKAGKNYQACCPFHNEKSPSFNVSPQKQFYHCFGCGVSGNAIGFLMAYEGLEFPEAVEELAGLHGLEVPREQSGGGYNSALPAPSKDLYALMGEIANFYQAELKHSKTAIDYLKGRGLDGSTVKRFAMGYVPNQWDAVLRRFGRDSNAQEQLLTAGMTIAREDRSGSYDRFRDRIMFPIRDKRGRVIGFGGRVLGEGTPKYLNSPETPLFHKGKELYGLYEARQSNKELRRVLIVEGYMDVVALAQYGINYAVATLGTATSSDHMHTLFRATPEVICCFDGDRAGRDAAWRALDSALSHLRDGRTLKFIFLPDGEDPDTLVRKEGREAFELRLDNADSFSDFMFKRLEQEASLAGEAGRSEVADRAVALIRRIPEGFTQEQLKDRLAQLMRWGDNRARVEALFKKSNAEAKQATRRPVVASLTPVRRAIALLVQYPEFAAQLPLMPELADSSERGMPFLTDLHAQIHATPQLSTAAILERYRGRREGELLNQLAAYDLFAGSSEPDIARELADTFEGLINAFLKERINQLQNQLVQQGLSDDEKQELMLLLAATK